jgi:hypothetical protein
LIDFEPHVVGEGSFKEKVHKNTNTKSDPGALEGTKTSFISLRIPLGSL